MFSLIYSTRHTSCGQLVRISDYRFQSREDLKLHQNFEPLKLHCPKCLLEINATHFEPWEFVRLGMERIADEMPLEQ